MVILDSAGGRAADGPSAARRGSFNRWRWSQALGVAAGRESRTLRIEFGGECG
jgi:hypothetical protein